MTEMWHRVTRQFQAVIVNGIEVLRLAARASLRHRARRLGAGLAFYSLFALVPTMFLSLAIVVAIFGREATEGRLVERLDGVVGVELAERIEEAVGDLWENSNTSGFAIVTLVVIVYSASVLFVAWRDSLEAIWGLPYQSGLKTTIRSRVFGALVPIAVGIFLAMILLAEVLTALAADLVTSPLLDAVVVAVGAISPTIASVLALALVYRVSTRLRPSWRDVWPAALMTGLSLAILAWGYGLYVRVYGSSSAAGVAGAVVLGLVFVNYSAQVLLYGAEVISTCADRRGRPLQRTGDQADDK